MTDIKELMDSINEVKLDIRELRTVIEKGVEQKFTTLDNRVTSLESTQRWLMVTIVGAVLYKILELVGL